MKQLLHLISLITVSSLVLVGCSTGPSVPIEEHTDDTEHMEDSMDHSSDEHAMHAHEPYELPEGVPAPTLELSIEEDAMSGWNVEMVTTNFTFTPENVNQDNVDGEGHAHIYVDGEKVDRVYGNWYHLTGLTEGEHEVTVELNTNQHDPYSVSGEMVTDSLFIEAGEGTHTHDDEDDHSMDGMEEQQ